MHVYRVAPYLENAAKGEAGHPLYIHRPQTGGRWDNADQYAALYVGTTPEAAIAEVFGNLRRWSDDMFKPPFLPGANRALVGLQIPDDLTLVNFDDGRTLQEFGVRPTQIVIRNSAYTRGLARQIFQIRDAGGARKWAGLQWWSYHRASWTNICLWGTPDDPFPAKLVDVTSLSLGHATVKEVARQLAKDEIS